MTVQAHDLDNPQPDNWPGPEHASDGQQIIEIPIAKLSVSDSPRLCGESAEHVRALAAAQVDLPPIIVHQPTMSIIDGVHRLRVAQLRGQSHIAVLFFDGDEADAFVLAVKSNIAHGLPLSLADKKYAARRIITSHAQWSDRMIATVTGLAAKTIADLRKCPTIPSVGRDVRIGRDGRIRPVDGTERRKAAVRLIEGNPDLSLREIARAAGISPETVRDVRNRLRRGENPLTRRQAAEGDKRCPDRARAGARSDRMPAKDRAAVVQRLKADPALRFSESGRALLRLLHLHAMSDQSWEKIIRHVPAHCHEPVTQLARECAQLWLHFAERVEQQAGNTV